MGLSLLSPSFAAEPDDPTKRLERALTPPLARVLRPLPPLESTDKAHKLAWMAELAYRVDALEHHSDSRAWRAIMHWPEPGDTLLTFDRAAPDVSPGRYPVPRGRDDPALDFAASVALGWLDERHFSCDFPLRARFLAEHDLIRRPTRFESGRCRDFERWAELDRVEAIEVVYVTPSWGDAAASMGHVIFRVRHSGAERVTGQSFEPIFAYAAIDDPDETPMYLLQGLTGGLTASIKVEAMGDVYRRYGVAEARDLVLYELTLSRDEIRYLLGEVHAQHRQQMAVPYAFLSVNCASLAYDLVRSVLPELPDRPALLSHPHEVVSDLLEAGRAEPLAILPSRYTRAAVLERRLPELFEAMTPALRSIPGLAALHRERTGDIDGRASALRALHGEIATQALDTNDADLLARYVDALIDIETWAIDRRLGRIDPAATSDALDAALDMRARLPIRDEERFLPPPRAALTPSGSRTRTIALGMIGDRPLMRLSLAVIDEATSEPRAAALRRSGRMTVLKNETTVALDDDRVKLEQQRVTIIDSATWSLGPATEAGWLGSRAGFHFAAETLSRPRDDLDFALRVRGGVAITLAGDADLANHLVLGSTFEGATWSHGGSDVRLGAGLFVETGIALGDQRLRAMVRTQPGWSFPAGFGWALESTVGLDMVLDGDDGVLMRIGYASRWDMPIADAWELTMGVGW